MTSFLMADCPKLLLRSVADRDAIKTPTTIKTFLFNIAYGL